MTSTVHHNSIEAYKHLNLSARQSDVVEALCVLGEATDTKIADYLGYTVNRVTGRVTELRDKGIIEEVGSVTGDFGQPNRVCRLISTIDSINITPRHVERKSNRKQDKAMTVSMAASILASARGMKRVSNQKQGLLF